MRFANRKFKVLNGKVGVKIAYNSIAPTYDSSKYLFWTRRIEKREEEVINKWLLSMKSMCLDVGCGTGRYSLRIALNYEVVALDFSIKMLKVLRIKALKRNLMLKIHLVLGDGENLPFRNNCFNSLICTLTFDHFKNSFKAASEFSRVLKRNSICILSTFNDKVLGEIQKKFNFKDKVLIKAENTPLFLIYEVGHSTWEIQKIFSRYGFKVIYYTGCRYWFLALSMAIICYPIFLDSLLSKKFRKLIDFAEIHITILKKN